MAAPAAANGGGGAGAGRRPSKGTSDAEIWSCSREEQVEELAQALLREYMHRKGFRDTLAAFDQEQPRTARTIGSRALMGDMMHIQKMQQQAKQSGAKNVTIMGMLAESRLQRRDRALASGGATDESDSDDLGDLRARAQRKDPLVRREQLRAQLQSRQEALARRGSAPGRQHTGRSREKEKKKEKKEKGKKHGKKDAAQKLMDQMLRLDEDDPSLRPLPSASAPAAAAPPAAPHAAGRASGQPGPAAEQPPGHAAPAAAEGGQDGKESDSSSSSDSSAQRARERRRRSSADNGAPPQAPRMGWGEADEPPAPLKTGWGDPPASPVPGTPPGDSGTRQCSTPDRHSSDAMPSPFGGLMAPGVRGRPIGPQQGDRLRRLMIGRLPRWPSSWLRQGFRFCADTYQGRRELAYGLLQNEGGPCGVLAVVQARVIQRLFFSGSHPEAGTGADLTSETQETALCDALADTLLEVSQGGSVSVVLPPDAHTVGEGHGRSPSKHVAADIDLQNWRVQSPGRHREDVRQVISQHLPFFMDGNGFGMLALVISCIITRGGADSVAADMDEDSCLVASHQYTSQELVSLLLYGRAHSNTIDGTQERRDGADRVVLRGVPRRSSIGLLSMTDHMGYTAVGENLKRPVWPIWLVYNESHYSVLFAKSLFKQEATAVELYYYDQHGNQEAEFHLTVDLVSGKGKSAAELRVKGDMTPYVEDIIRTRGEWAHAEVSWNGADELSIPL
eukprot:TRINITY_DN24500_c1_g1_i1.p1 TRINITY_DN24500_c1_g1~~TRINITY_DN24500_c1_g1_i1.p1  ORF type:complete len:733 (+),score=212.54 TRINITY_DN24500_c1_g1_i1:86-2284(+)